jgi:hypothetical protein
MLLASWMLLAWMFGDSSDIRWLRNWCAGIFILTAVSLCAGGGFYLTYKVLRTSHRQAVQEMAHLLNERIKEGRTEDVRDALDHLASEPSEDSGFSSDILQRIKEVTNALEQTRNANVATQDETLH